MGGVLDMRVARSVRAMRRAEMRRLVAYVVPRMRRVMDGILRRAVRSRVREAIRPGRWLRAGRGQARWRRGAGWRGGRGRASPGFRR